MTTNTDTPPEVVDFIDWLLDGSPWELRGRDLDEGRISAICFPDKLDLIDAYADWKRPGKGRS